MDFFVQKNSIVRRIWGNADTILFIFAGASAEFALNKAVDWLYFTGRLPADPLARLFSTVSYARNIVFLEEQKALESIDQITAIHRSVEESRGSRIPDWAYRDVLFMLIDYSIRSFELLERKLSESEKEDVFNVFFRVGKRMELRGLPQNYIEWVAMREKHLQTDLQKSPYTTDLFKQYRKHLGIIRYELLLQTQLMLLPLHVRKLLNSENFSWLGPMLIFYKLSRKVKMDKVLRSLLLPADYYKQVEALDQPK